MGKPNKRLCLISGVSFLAGAWVGIFMMVILPILSQSGSYHRKQKIRSFFYKTMYVFFEGTYDPNEGSISPKPLKTITEYEPRLGKKCEFFINDSSPDYTEGIAFFPSGDFFYVLIDRKGKSWIINQFNHLIWDKEWSEILYRIGER